MTYPAELLGKFVTAKTTLKEEVVQGAVIGFWRMRVRGQSGEEWEVLPDSAVAVSNPPEPCAICELPLGPMCGRCDKELTELGEILSSLGPVDNGRA